MFEGSLNNENAVGVREEEENTRSGAPFHPNHGYEQHDPQVHTRHGIEENGKRCYPVLTSASIKQEKDRHADEAVETLQRAKRRRLEKRSDSGYSSDYNSHQLPIREEHGNFERKRPKRRSEANTTHVDCVRPLCDDGVILLRCNKTSEEEEIVRWLEGRENDGRNEQWHEHGGLKVNECGNDRQKPRVGHTEHEQKVDAHQQEEGTHDFEVKHERMEHSGQHRRYRRENQHGHEEGRQICKEKHEQEPEKYEHEENRHEHQHGEHRQENENKTSKQHKHKHEEGDEQSREDQGHENQDPVPKNGHEENSANTSMSCSSCRKIRTPLNATCTPSQSNDRERVQDVTCEEEQKQSYDHSVVDSFFNSSCVKYQLPRKPTFFSSQMEMGRILKQRIDLIMKHYHNIERLREAFDQVEFIIYTARYRMVREQTEQRVHQTEAGLSPTARGQKSNQVRQRVFMCNIQAKTKENHQRLKEEVAKRPRTLFVVIADECHWDINQSTPENMTAHDKFINDWSKEPSPRNVVVLLVSATPLNLLTSNSRIPETKCARVKEESGQEKLVIPDEGSSQEVEAKHSTTLELHTVRWEEVQFMDFEKGLRTKLQSTPLVSQDSRKQLPEYLAVRAGQCASVISTPDPQQASEFLIQGDNGVVSLHTDICSTDGSIARYVLAVSDGKLVAQRKDALQLGQVTKFKALLEFGVGLVAFRCLQPDIGNSYICIDASRKVDLAVPRIRKKRDVPIIQPQCRNPRQQCFVFHIEPCCRAGEEQFRYLGLNYYLSTMSNEGNDKKFRDDSSFQEIVMQGQKRFSDDDMLAADYAYHVLHRGMYHSEESILLALRGKNDLITRTLTDYSKQLQITPNCILGKVLMFVRRNVVKSVLRKLRDSSHVVGLKDWVACHMHLTKNERDIHLTAAHPLQQLAQEQLAQNPDVLVNMWMRLRSDISETSRIVNDLITNRKNAGGMKIIGAKSQKTADVFFNTIKLAQNVAGFEQSFHLMKDYGTHHIENQMKEDESRFFFQKFQAGYCRREHCSCQEYMSSPTDVKCQRCFHLHKRIAQYADLDGLPCMLLLIGKGRTGDTFPNCFNCLDLRVSFDRTAKFKQKPDSYLTTVVQMLGRMCRYVKAKPHSTSTVPYALLGWRLCDVLRRSLRESPAFSTVDCLVDRYKSPSIYRHPFSKQLCHNETAQISDDRKNHQKHTNRLLLHAEPQIGKTGSYLYLLKLLRQEITKNTKDKETRKYDVHPNRVKNKTKEQLIGGREYVGHERSNRDNRGERLEQHQIKCGVVVALGSSTKRKERSGHRKVLETCSKPEIPRKKPKEITKKSPQTAPKNATKAGTLTKVSERYLLERKHTADIEARRKVEAAEKCPETMLVTKEVRRIEVRVTAKNKEKGAREKISEKMGIRSMAIDCGPSNHLYDGEGEEDTHWSFRKRRKSDTITAKPTRQTSGSTEKKLGKSNKLKSAGQGERKQSENTRQKVKSTRKENHKKFERRRQLCMMAKEKGSDASLKRAVRKRPPSQTQDEDDESDTWKFRRRKWNGNVYRDRLAGAKFSKNEQRPRTLESTPRQRGQEQVKMHKRVVPVTKRTTLNGNEVARQTTTGHYIDQTHLVKARRTVSSRSFQRVHQEKEHLKWNEVLRRNTNDSVEKMKVSEDLAAKTKVAQAVAHVIRTAKNKRLVMEKIGSTLQRNNERLEKRSVNSVSEWMANSNVLMKREMKPQHQRSLDTDKTSVRGMSKVKEMKETTVHSRTGLGMVAARKGDRRGTKVCQAKGTIRVQEEKNRVSRPVRHRTGECAVKRKEPITKANTPCQVDERVPTTAKELLDGPVGSPTVKQVAYVHGVAKREETKKRKLGPISRGSQAAMEISISSTGKHLQEIHHEAPTHIKRKRNQLKSVGSCRGQLEEDDYVLLDNLEESDVEDNVMEGTERNWRYPAWRDMKQSESLLFRPVRKGSTSTVNGQTYTHKAEENPVLLTDDWSPKSQIQDTRTKVSLQSQLPELVEPRDCRAWHDGHVLHCVNCRSWFEKLENPLELSLFVPLGEGRVPIRLSIPTGAPYADVYRKLQCNGLPTKRGDLYNRHRPGVKYWIFHPCDRAPQGCLLNYRHVLGDEQASCIQAVVVQRQRFHSYKRQWGRSHMIIQLPSCSHDVAEGDCPLGCPDWSSKGGIGYARRFIQLFAYALKMEYVFILDNNIMFMAEAVFPSRSLGPLRKEGSGALVMKRCPFTRPLKVMKELVQGQHAPPMKEFEPYPFECITKSSHAKRYPMYSYTGPAKDIDSARDKGYALLGMLGRYPKVRCPFSRTHVSGAVLLNVKATVENDVFYRPWPCWDDVRFSDDCDLNRLWMVRFNRFLFAKALNRDCVEDDKISTVYEWTEGTELKHSGRQEIKSSEEAEVDTLLTHLRQQVHIDQRNDSCRRLCLHNSSQEGKSNEHNLLNKIYQGIPVPDCSEFLPVTSLYLTYSPQNASTEPWEMFSTITKSVHKRVMCVMLSADARNLGMTTLQAIRDTMYVCDAAARRRKSRVCVYSAFDPSIAHPRFLLIDVTFKEDSLPPTLIKANNEVALTRPTAYEYLENLLAT